ncbi:Hypothetical protein NTJ_01588 [Nesidiocoris tenuis]|uniref:Uncharacterized protein n=1 Tax=Nesidiocoris tenuis TaxID=355587 RepID=A0ABN7A900_9HEMI|nr:Hypothetical protein NTJ_01588 [Nesidiocoris tenuis]
MPLSFAFEEVRTGEVNGVRHSRPDFEEVAQPTAGAPGNRSKIQPIPAVVCTNPNTEPLYTVDAPLTSTTNDPRESGRCRT